MKIITKAVIAAAGKGTRFLPATKAVPKEMLPILEKPGIQYIIEELTNSGITDIAIVTNGEEQDITIKKHFGRSPELEEHLKKNSKGNILEEIKKIEKLANFIFIKQDGPYGNGTPCLCAKNFVKNEPFIYAYGDDLVLSKSKPMTRVLIEKYKKNPGIIMAAEKIPTSEISRYGIPHIKNKDTMEFDYVIEKPLEDEAPSNLATFGRYVLEKEVLEILEEKKLGKDDELWTVDAITECIKRGGKGYIAKVPNGDQWLTTGDPLRMLKATIQYALARNEYKNELKTFIKSIKDE